MIFHWLAILYAEVCKLETFCLVAWKSFSLSLKTFHETDTRGMVSNKVGL